MLRTSPAAQPLRWVTVLSWQFQCSPGLQHLPVLPRKTTSIHPRSRSSDAAAPAGRGEAGARPPQCASRSQPRRSARFPLQPLSRLQPRFHRPPAEKPRGGGACGERGRVECERDCERVSVHARVGPASPGTCRNRSWILRRAPANRSRGAAVNSRGRLVPSCGDATHTESLMTKEVALMRWEGWESRSWEAFELGHLPESWSKARCL